MSKQRIFTSFFSFFFLTLILVGCQESNTAMDPAAIQIEVKKQFEERGLAVIDSMTAICDKRVEETTN